MRGRRVPTRYMSIDLDSTPPETLVEVGAALLQLAVQEHRALEPREELQEILLEMYRALHPCFRREMEGKVSRALALSLAKPPAVASWPALAKMWSLRLNCGVRGAGMRFETAKRRIED